MTYIVDVIVLTKDNLADLDRTLISCCSQAVPYGVDMRISIIDSSLDHAAVRSLAASFQLIHTSASIGSVHLFPPPGIYQSMNCAINMTEGDSLVFMNSGDTFYDTSSMNALAAELMSANDQTWQAACVFGQTEFHAYNSWLRWISPTVPTHLITAWLRFFYPCHQAVMFESSWAKHHLYSTAIGHIADGQVIRLALDSGRSIRYVSRPVACFFLNGVSSKAKCLSQSIMSFSASSRLSHVNLIKSLLSPPFLPSLVPFWSFVRHILFQPVIYAHHCMSKLQ
jgi:hypothetical protein